jgi:predicted sugar kinase
LVRIGYYNLLNGGFIMAGGHGFERPKQAPQSPVQEKKQVPAKKK